MEKAVTAWKRLWSNGRQEGSGRRTKSRQIGTRKRQEGHGRRDGQRIQWVQKDLNNRRRVEDNGELFGDEMGSKPQGTVRVIFQNVN